MGMTMTQKILAQAAGLTQVQAGQLIEAQLDLVLGNDITSPVAIKEMDKMKVQGVFDKDKIALVPDHFVPNKDIKSAEHCKCVREFARRNEITNYFEVGEMGIEPVSYTHLLLKTRCTGKYLLCHCHSHCLLLLFLFIQLVRSAQLFHTSDP